MEEKQGGSGVPINTPTPQFISFIFRMSLTDFDAKQLEKIADALTTVFNPEEPLVSTPLYRIASALEVIAKKLDGINTLDSKIPPNAKNPKPVGIEPLTGEDLLNKVREIGDVSKSELVEACGYIIPAKGNNKQRLHYTAFYEALLNAKGVDMDQLKEDVSK